MNTSKHFVTDHTTASGMEASALSRGKKLVHLDLKGAPPRLNYLYEVQKNYRSCDLHARCLVSVQPYGIDLDHLFYSWSSFFLILVQMAFLLSMRICFPMKESWRFFSQNLTHHTGEKTVCSTQSAIRNINLFIYSMFVWSHCRSSTYSREEILAIQDAAYSRGLEIIPLVQTFGHLEVSDRGE